jgi:hypothetical protein
MSARRPFASLHPARPSRSLHASRRSRGQSFDESLYLARRCDIVRWIGILENLRHSLGRQAGNDRCRGKSAPPFGDRSLRPTEESLTAVTVI